MHHKLDINPIPENVLYVNELSLAGKVPYETKDMTEKALTGKTRQKGGILPDDNVRMHENGKWKRGCFGFPERCKVHSVS